MWLALAAILSAVSLVLYRIMTSPELRYHGAAYKVKAKLFFWLGDVRRLGAFPWVTWDSREHRVTTKDARHGSMACRPGDVGLHRDDGFLSNLAIPGAFKHAWVVVDGDDCVEAISDGVVRRDNMVPLTTDYAVILRPIGASREDVSEAVRRAKTLVGCDYDANFAFDFEKSQQHLFKEETRRFEKDLACGASTNIKCGAYHSAFSCTEVAGFTWWHCKDKLRIFRSAHAGREAIIADDFLRMGFSVAWLSPSVTMEWALAHGLHEEGRQKIKEFLKSSGK
jgi:hypothetical protein